MAASHNVELEAAKFLQKLIHESKDEPAKLATKLYVILQHMKASGKEHSMPFQVISRAMETVINQHGLDIETLKSSRLPLSGGSQMGDSASTQFAGSLQPINLSNDYNTLSGENDAPKSDLFSSSRPHIVPTIAGRDSYQGSGALRSSQCFDHESPSSLDTRSANSQSQERHDSANRDKQLHQKDNRKAAAKTKRKRGDSSLPSEPLIDNPQQGGIQNDAGNPRKGKMNKVEQSLKSGQVHGGMLVTSDSSTIISSGKALEHERGSSMVCSDANKIFQGGRLASNSEMALLRSSVPNDTGKAPASLPLALPSMPFNEQQLRQLRAQCLVFLAFRNGLMPKKFHVEIALGSIFHKEDGPQKDPMANKESETSNIADKSSLLPETLIMADENTHMVGTRKLEDEIHNQGAIKSQGFCEKVSMQPDSAICGDIAVGKNVEGVDQSSVIPTNKQVDPKVTSWTGIENQNEGSRGQHEFTPEMSGSVPNQLENLNNSSLLGKTYSDGHSTSFTTREQWKPISHISHDNQIMVSSRTDGGEMTKHSSHDGCKIVSVENALRKGTALITELAEGDNPVPLDFPRPKYTMLEKWILDTQKKKLLVEQNCVLKRRRTEKSIATTFNKLKENVSTSEDISARTKSVIELKKLQLLELQRRLRRDFLNDFFKPIGGDMDRLRSCKKHKHGRRIKQLDKYEQRMKEERQKRIRDRQKDFFGEIEAHKERLDEVFKIKRERWKGFNKYVKEFHKKKERVHREKYDRIQREKINLLKINDVEGYLRMVQDAKSDRVKQLLKETEKYLQKLGSRLQEAKSVASCFESDADQPKTLSFVQKYETVIDNEDESDQAKHYLESNEKYYMMAHSVKENITDQPASLLGGRLREYQMNGLRWLVSLYNNHLNGILADEMGLGKTVQVISLICYLMETKNDRGPFLVVVPSSVLPGWESEINFWSPAIHKIVYSGPPEERRKLFKERIVPQKFNVLLTTYEYLMNKHDRPKLSKVHWHYIIIDEGHRIKNASCKLNADLKHYRSSHRLLLTGTPLQNNLEELWALLNFLLPNIFNSSEDFSQWFNKPFESNGDNSADEALLSEEENLLIINRLHQVLRPFVLRRLKHKVENELPEKIERLVRCEASAYQNLLMKRVEENLGSIGNPKARSVHNSVMELRNICNHPYISQLHAEEVDNLIPKHYLPPIIRLCGKLETLDRLLPKLKAADHRVLFFSTMTRLLDVMEDYLTFKHYQYLRLDGHTSGGDRGPLIDKFNQPNSPYFIFLLSIRAGGVGVNLQAADTVILFDTDWNPQVDLQAQARAHRIGQKRDVLVLRFETVKTVEEQVRASAEHKLGVANQSITAGFFDNNTSAEDRREYLESLLRECKKEEDAPVLDDDSLNDLLARSEPEIDIFELVDKQRREEEMAAWRKLLLGERMDWPEPLPPLPSRLVTKDDLREFCKVMNLVDAPKAVVVPESGAKRKGENLGGLDTKHYGRGKRAREVRSYEEQWTEEEFEKLCQADESPGSPRSGEEAVDLNLSKDAQGCMPVVESTEPHASTPLLVTQPHPLEFPQLQVTKEVTPPSKRGRGRPRRSTSDKSPAAAPLPPQHSVTAISGISSLPGITLSIERSDGGITPHVSSNIIPVSQHTASILPVTASVCPPAPVESKGQNTRVQTGTTPRRRGKKQEKPPTSDSSVVAHPKLFEQVPKSEASLVVATVPSNSSPLCPNLLPGSPSAITLKSQPTTLALAVAPISQSLPFGPSVPVQSQKTQSGGGAPKRRGRKGTAAPVAVPIILASPNPEPPTQSNDTTVQDHPSQVLEPDDAPSSPEPIIVLGVAQRKYLSKSLLTEDNSAKFLGPATVKNPTADLQNVALVTAGGEVGVHGSSSGSIEVVNNLSTDHKINKAMPTSNTSSHDCVPSIDLPSNAAELVSASTAVVAATVASASQAMVEPVHTRRQGRKVPIRRGEPKRRGRKHGSVLSAIADGSADRLPNANFRSTGSIEISPRVNKEMGPQILNFTPVITSEGPLSGEQVSQESKRKETSVPPYFARIQTADVARVMKEIFSESCPSKSRISEPSVNERVVASTGSMLGKLTPEEYKNQSPENKAFVSVPALATEVRLDSSIQEPGSENVAEVMDEKTPISAGPAFRNSDESNSQSKNSADCLENVMPFGNVSPENSTVKEVVKSNEGDIVMEVSTNQNLDGKEYPALPTAGATTKVVNPSADMSGNQAEAEAHGIVKGPFKTESEAHGSVEVMNVIENQSPVDGVLSTLQTSGTVSKLDNVSDDKSIQVCGDNVDTVVTKGMTPVLDEATFPRDDTSNNESKSSNSSVENEKHSEIPFPEDTMPVNVNMETSNFSRIDLQVDFKKEVAKSSQKEGNSSEAEAHTDVNVEIMGENKVLLTMLQVFGNDDDDVVTEAKTPISDECIFLHTDVSEKDRNHSSDSAENELCSEKDLPEDSMPINVEPCVSSHKDLRDIEKEAVESSGNNEGGSEDHANVEVMEVVKNGSPEDNKSNSSTGPISATRAVLSNSSIDTSIQNSLSEADAKVTKERSCTFDELLPENLDVLSKMESGDDSHTILLDDAEKEAPDSSANEGKKIVEVSINQKVDDKECLFVPTAEKTIPEIKLPVDELGKPSKAKDYGSVDAEKTVGLEESSVSRAGPSNSDKAVGPMDPDHPSTENTVSHLDPHDGGEIKGEDKSVDAELTDTDHVKIVSNSVSGNGANNDVSNVDLVRQSSSLASEKEDTMDEPNIFIGERVDQISVSQLEASEKLTGPCVAHAEHVDPMDIVTADLTVSDANDQPS